MLMSRTIHAIILAAGIGKRLHVCSGGRPKCLLEIGGRSLLDRYLQCLAAEGVTQVTIVVGYKQALVRSAFGSEGYGISLDYLENEQYERGNVVSLWLACQVMKTDTLIMDADVLFHPEILHRLIHSTHPTALLMDETVTQQSEECMVVAQNGRVVALTKQVSVSYDEIGEGVGFLKVHADHLPQLKAVIQACINEDKLDWEYEDALLPFFSQVSVGFERIGGYPWLEIDFPEDVLRAERDILPNIQAMLPQS